MIKQLLIALNLLVGIGFSGLVFASNELPKEISVKKENILIDESVPLGIWVGVLDLGFLKLTLAFDISQDSNGITSAKLACQEQGISDFPVNVLWQDGILKCEMKALGAIYEGLFNQEKTEVIGQFKQNGGSFPLTLKKEEKLTVSMFLRPQEPKAPYPYDEEEVKYSSSAADVTLAGTLTLPRSEKPSPVVLLIAGSGPSDRNETIFGHKPFLVLADHLTKQGIAVLRIDKRGVGQSTGNYDVSTGEDFAADVLACIEYLKTRKEVDAKQIGLIGHSEGGILAPIVAVKSNDVAFIVLMAGPGVTGEAIIYEQGALLSRAMGVAEEQISHQLGFQKEMFSIIKNESDLEKAEKLLREIVAKQLANLPTEEQQINADAMEAQIKRCNSKWFRYFLTYDPITSLKHLKIPVLVINGELDLQVSPKQNLPVIAKILKEAGNQNYRIIEFPKLNHLFQTCESGSIAEYGKIEETIAPVVLNTLSDWILETTTNVQKISVPYESDYRKGERHAAFDRTSHSCSSGKNSADSC